ncbi:tyrosine-type recombinase/integrase [Paraburkholderia sediminicola]|uniref:tyrosine-type recombinase/integrase n=1 Tax=Paraburkholderia sediminicola TaxID=458836 RepID=UPI0038BA16CE
MNVCVYRAKRLPSELPEAQSQLPEGFPFLVDDDELEVVDVALRYLHNEFIVMARRGSRETADAAAYDLADWYRYLAGIPRNWADISVDDIVDYREDRLSLISRQTHNSLKSRTVTRRVSRVLHFYDWASTAGLYFGGALVHRETRSARRDIDRISLAHTAPASAFTSQEVSMLLPPDDSESDINILSVDHWRTLSQQLGPLPSDKQRKEMQSKDLRNSRDRLVAEFALQTGMRADEIANLSKSQILNTKHSADLPEYSTVKIRIEKTKGRRPRFVEVPVYLLNELKLYIKGERAEAVAASTLSSESEVPEPTSLFVNGIAAKSDAGRSITADTVSRRFHEAVLAEGITRTVTKVDPDTCAIYLAEVAAYSFHDLRHTFAVWTYQAERESGNAEPWKRIQVLLGHRQLHTTLDIYLKHAGTDRKPVNEKVFRAIRERFDDGD